MVLRLCSTAVVSWVEVASSFGSVSELCIVSSDDVLCSINEPVVGSVGISRLSDDVCELETSSELSLLEAMSVEDKPPVSDNIVSSLIIETDVMPDVPTVTGVEDIN